MWISDGLRIGSGPLSVPDNPANWQSLETLGFPLQVEPLVLALSAYAYQRGLRYFWPTSSTGSETA